MGETFRFAVRYRRLGREVRSSVPARKVAVDPLIALAVFPIIFIGELPDKTMFASLVMATRGRPRQVWLGAAGAFVIHVIIAVTVGLAIFAILPHRAVEGFVAVMFLFGAA
jgi:Ca2+/H+ antiporter, TMEM165/GDT1 family